MPGNMTTSVYFFLKEKAKILDELIKGQLVKELPQSILHHTESPARRREAVSLLKYLTGGKEKQLLS
ncbi:MAG: hypothetical protein JWN83_118 [Chitinophagaceae bacterium]|nr:hypothetical protein [Chitinophagaceae bacterium]